MPSVDSSLARFLMRGGTIVGLLDQMNQENDNDELRGVLEVWEEGRLLNELAAQNQEGLFDSTPTPTDTPSGMPLLCLLPSYVHVVSFPFILYNYLQFF